MFAVWTVTEQLETWIPIAFFVSLWVMLQWKDKLPSIDSLQAFVNMLNSRGGNILILAAASLYFFKWSLYLFLRLIDLVITKQLTPDNAIALMAVQFASSTAFGGVSGALLKTMTGESTKARATDSNNVEMRDVPVIQSGPTKPPSQNNIAANHSQMQASPDSKSPSNVVYGVQLRDEIK